jgi:hypothetical protein
VYVTDEVLGDQRGRVLPALAVPPLLVPPPLLRGV